MMHFYSLLRKRVIEKSWLITFLTRFINLAFKQLMLDFDWLKQSKNINLFSSSFLEINESFIVNNHIAKFDQEIMTFFMVYAVFNYIFSH